MNRNEKSPDASLAAASGLEQMDDNSGELLSNNNDNLFPPLRQIATNCRLKELMSQASRLMEADPHRCGDHFLIWLSLFAAKNGVDWEAQK